MDNPYLIPILMGSTIIILIVVMWGWIGVMTVRKIKWMLARHHREQMEGVTDPSRLGAILKKNKCPDCGGNALIEGPHGGATINMYCGNPKCRSAFNFLPAGQGYADRIGKAPDWVYQV